MVQWHNRWVFCFLSVCLFCFFVLFLFLFIFVLFCLFACLFLFCFVCLFVCLFVLCLFLFYFVFSFHFSKPEIVLGLPKWEFPTGKKHFTLEKKFRKNEFAPSEKYSSYAPGVVTL